MGLLRITTHGSFSSPAAQDFPASESGHAVAVKQAIEYLNGIFPEAIARDKKLRKEGRYPVDRFKAAERLGLLDPPAGEVPGPRVPVEDQESSEESHGEENEHEAGEGSEAGADGEHGGGDEGTA